MKTYIYMVRHAESPFSLENERTRGLSEKGMIDVEIVTEILKNENIDAVVSSPYTRAIQTVEGIASFLGVDIDVYEDLRERPLAGLDFAIDEKDFIPSITRAFDDLDFALPGGESNKQAEARSVIILSQLLDRYKGKKVAIGTHGNIMTIMMGYFNPAYGLEFWQQTSKPDIYKLTFESDKLLDVERLWDEKYHFIL